MGKRNVAGGFAGTRHPRTGLQNRNSEWCPKSQ